MPLDVVKKVRAESMAFFDQPLEMKQSCAVCASVRSRPRPAAHLKTLSQGLQHGEKSLLGNLQFWQYSQSFQVLDIAQAAMRSTRITSGF